MAGGLNSRDYLEQIYGQNLNKNLISLIDKVGQQSQTNRANLISYKQTTQIEMNKVYILVPLFNIDSKQHIQKKAVQLLGLNPETSDSNIKIYQINQNQFALQIAQLKLHFLEINRILQQYSKTIKQIDLLQSVVKDFQYEIPYGQQLVGDNVDSIMKKMKKYKDLKEQNKKLKKLLQVQLQNTQKVREETQKTMKVLRQQFDALVLEIAKKQKNSAYAHSAHQSHSIGESQSKQLPVRQKTTLSGISGLKPSSIR